MNQGGGLHNLSGGLILNNVQILNNFNGFGITNELGQLQFTDGIVSDNIGGGLRNDEGTAVLGGLIINGNTLGGGIHNKGTVKSNLTITGSSIHNNTSTSGAGLYNEGSSSSATIETTQISYNTAAAEGGGISNKGDLILKNSTIDHNTAKIGGGIDHQGFSLKADNVTISSNTGTDNGGGIANQASATLTNVTLSGNAAGGVDTGGNILNDGDAPQISLVNSIVANPGVGGNCINTTGVITSLGHNLESTDSCGFTSSGDMVDTDPLLGLLQNNGGPTTTHALLYGSPAIDKGDGTNCPNHDQRIVSRPLDGDANSTAVCDIGAFEAGSLICAITATTYSVAGLSLTFTNLGANLSCIRVTGLPHNHDNATAGIQTGRYWNIDGLQADGVSPADTDFIFNLTLPHTVSPDTDAKICKYPGGLGGGGWACDRTGSKTNTVWLNDIQGGFSDWAVGNNVGPTALALESFSVSPDLGQTYRAYILFGMFLTFTFFWWIRSKKKRLP